MHQFLRFTHRANPLRALVVAAALTLIGSLASAQGGGMELTVQDAKGKVLKGVNINAVVESTGDSVGTAVTNKKGIVKLDFPAEGFYSLEASKDGYPEQIGRVEIKKGMTTSLGMTLYTEATLTTQQAIDAFNDGVAQLQSPGQEAEALANFVDASRLDPSLIDAHRLTAILAANTGDLELTENAMNAFLAAVPEGMPAIAPAVYMVYRKTGRSSELPPVRDALRTAGFAGNVAIGVFNEGVKALKDEKTDDAKALFTEALLLDSSLTVAYRSLAALDFNEGRFEAALPNLEKLLELNPQHRDGNRMAFFSYVAEGNTTDAVTVGKAWAAKDKNAAEEISARATEHYENGRAQDARTYADLALAVDPDSPYGNYTMGRVLAGAGDIAKAKEHLQRFIDLAPSHPEAASAKAMIEGL